MVNISEYTGYFSALVMMLCWYPILEKLQFGDAILDELGLTGMYAIQLTITSM